MDLIKVNKFNISLAAAKLRTRSTVVYPTETAYGLGADPFCLVAVKKIYQIKGRNFKKPLPLIADSYKTVEKYFFLTALEKNLAKRYWPGPLTILLKSKKQLTKLKDFFKVERIAVRVSSSKTACQLARGCKGLVTATSANISGAGECYSIVALKKQFDSSLYKPDLILDDGRLKKIRPSTMVIIEGRKISILRQGSLKLN